MTSLTIQLNVTDKEKELVGLLADGYSAMEISQELKVNRRTLESKIAAMKSKYKSANVCNLVATFLRNKLID